jgi:hypothetical protein
LGTGVPRVIGYDKNFPNALLHAQSKSREFGGMEIKGRNFELLAHP